jgi:hypothetical protein
MITLSSRRPGAARWSQISLYRLDPDGYVVEKVGISAVAHDPRCAKVRPDMIAWADAQREDREIERIGCAECQPRMDDMDAQLRLERTRHRAFVVPDADGLVSVLTEDRIEVPILITRVLDSAAELDERIARSWLVGST